MKMRLFILGVCISGKVLYSNHAKMPAPARFNCLLNVPLLDAVEANDIKKIEGLLKKRADPNAHDHCARTVLMQASRQGSIKAVTLLLQRGVNVNAVDDRNWTALMHAVYKEKKTIVKLLLAGGADAHMADHDANTPLMLAAYRGNIEIVKMLLSVPEIKINSVGESFFECLEDYTALMLAALGGHEEVVSLLIQAGAHIGFKSLNGQGAKEYGRNYPKVIALIEKFEKEQTEKALALAAT